MLGAAAVTAQCVTGKATRDALFLTSLDFTALPAMLVATSVWSILLVTAHARARADHPARAADAVGARVSGSLFAAEWSVRAAAPAATAVVVYLHVTGSTSLLASSVLADRQRTLRSADGEAAHRPYCRRRYPGRPGRRPARGADGRHGSASPRCFCSWRGSSLLPRALIRMHRSVRRSRSGRANVHAEVRARRDAAGRSRLRVVADAPHLHHLAALVLLGTTSAALLDYLFKARAAREPSAPATSCFASSRCYYAGTSLVTFVLQTASEPYRARAFRPRR